MEASLRPFRATVLAAVVAALAAVALPSPAEAAPDVLDDVVQDVGDRRADIAALSVDQDGGSLVVGVRVVEFTDPRSDPHWADVRSPSVLQVSVDASGDGKEDYRIDFRRVLAGTKRVLAVTVVTGTLQPRCTGSYTLDPKGGWIRLSAPKGCLAGSGGYRVQATLGFSRTVDNARLGAAVDFAPGEGRWHPFLPRRVNAPTSSVVTVPYVTLPLPKPQTSRTTLRPFGRKTTTPRRTATTARPAR